MFVLNPFKNHDVSEFPDTHIDLADAEHHNPIVSTHQPTSNATKEKTEDDHSSGKDSDAHSGHGGASIRAGTTRGLTLAELREEIDNDVGANDSQSIYDRKFSRVDFLVCGVRRGLWLTRNQESLKLLIAPLRIWAWDGISGSCSCSAAVDGWLTSELDT